MAAHYMEACAFTLTPTTPLRERVGLYDVVYRDGKIPAWKGGSELHNAVENGDEVYLAEMLSYGDLRKRVNELDSAGHAPLHLCCMSQTRDPERYGMKEAGKIECVKMLIAAGADVNIRGPGANTPMHIAANAHYPQVEIIEMLIEAGADIKAVDEFGDTPIHRTVVQHRDGAHPSVILVLMKHADFNEAKLLVNRNKKTAVQIAVELYVEMKEEYNNLTPAHCEVRTETQTRSPDARTLTPTQPLCLVRCACCSRRARASPVSTPRASRASAWRGRGPAGTTRSRRTRMPSRGTPFRGTSSRPLVSPRR